MVLIPISLCSLRCTKQVEAVLDLVPRQRIIRFEGESGGTWFWLYVTNERVVREALFNDHNGCLMAKKSRPTNS